MIRFSPFLVVVTGAFLLQACSNGDDNDAARQFTSWNDVNPGETVVIDGRVAYADYETNLNTGFTTAGETQREDAEASVTYDQNSNLERVEIDVDTGAGVNIPDPDVEFDENDGDQVDLNFAGLVGGAVSASEDEVGLWAEPSGLGFNYQTFGVWLTGYNTGAGVVAAGSFGAMTDPANVPTLGEATYTGAASGFAIDASGTPFLVASDAAVGLNFGTGAFNFQTTNSVKDNLVDAFELAFVGDPNFNLSGSGNLAGNSLTGTVAAGYAMTGNIEGWLYGPAGSEVGGLFELEGVDGRYAGSFGAVD